MPDKRKNGDTQEPDQSQETCTKKAKSKAGASKEKPFVPTLRSGGWAILVALHMADGKSLSKRDLIMAAQPLCDSSFTVPSDLNRFYTAWSSAKMLIDKGLLYKSNLPPKYCLSDEGITVARSLLDAQRSMSSMSGAGVGGTTSVVASSSQPRKPKVLRTASSEKIATNTATRSVLSPLPAAALTKFPILESSMPFINVEIPIGPSVKGHVQVAEIIEPGEYQVELILDNREIIRQIERDLIETACRDAKIKLNIRPLEVGDAMWIARDKLGGEYVLDFIMERKRLDDLAASIKDGRFQEQKFRLKKSGLRHVIYLIEDFNAYHVSQFLEAIQTSIIGLQITDGFFVKRVPTFAMFVKYLVLLTKRIEDTYIGEHLHVIQEPQMLGSTLKDVMGQLDPNTSHVVEYSQFAPLMSKSTMLTVGDVFIKMLMKIRGISGEKALEIQRIFKTPRGLINAYIGLGETEAKVLVMSRCAGYGRKKIGPALSEKIWHVWAS